MATPGSEDREADAGERRPPVLVLFVSRRQPRSRRAEALVAETLTRREARSRLRVLRIELEQRPDLFERFRVARPPALLLVEQSRIRGRLAPPGRAAEIAALLAPWLGPAGT